MNPVYFPQGLFLRFCLSAIGYCYRFHPVGWLTDWLTGHDCHESGPVSYILEPPTIVPWRGPLGFCNLFVVTGEGHPIWFTITCLFSLIKKPSCWSFKVAELFVSPGNSPWWLIHPVWTVLLKGWEDSLLQRVNSRLYTMHLVYNSWYIPQFRLQVFRIGFPIGCRGLRYVGLVTSRSSTWSTLHLWSDKEISSDTCHYSPGLLSCQSLMSIL